MVVGEATAALAAAAWEGPRTPDGEFLWYGPNNDARLAGDIPKGRTLDVSVTQTLCQNGTCHGVPLGLGDEWIQLFVQKNSPATWQDVTPQTFASFFENTVREFDSMSGTSVVDLSEFRAAMGNMITEDWSLPEFEC
jgi:hypothetical protein